MPQDKKFQRKVEDFHCGHCGRLVRGDGYTNHCPECLYSMHVDVNPGDRAQSCRGLMAPVDFEVKGAEYVVVHRCMACGFVRRNRTRPEDSMDAVLDLARRRAVMITESDDPAGERLIDRRQRARPARPSGRRR
jgi:hypothetical protein